MTEATAGAAIVGKRDGQEDAFRIVAQNDRDVAADLLLLVADGMGGHAGGEVASNVTLDVFRRSFVASTETRPGRRLHGAMLAANAAVAQRVASDPSLRGMGCTLIAALRRNDTLHWISVGDSLLYRKRGDRLERLNADHSVFGQLMEKARAGEITEAEARAHPNRNALRSAVMGGDIPLVDVNHTTLEPGDLVVLATDGIETLGAPALTRLLIDGAAMTPRDITDRVLAAVDALGHPRQDNTTVVAYRHGAGLPATGPVVVPGQAAAPTRRRLVQGAAGIAALALVGVVIYLWPFDRRPVDPDRVAATTDPAPPPRVAEPVAGIPPVARPDPPDDGSQPTAPDGADGAEPAPAEGGSDSAPPADGGGTAPGDPPGGDGAEPAPGDAASPDTPADPAPRDPSPGAADGAGDDAVDAVPPPPRPTNGATNGTGNGAGNGADTGPGAGAGGSGAPEADDAGPQDTDAVAPGPSSPDGAPEK